MLERSSATRADIDPGTTALVFDDPFGTPAGRPCPLLRRPSASGPRDVLAIRLTGSPTEYLRSWRRSAHHEAERFRIISVDPDATARSSAESTGPIERVSNPGDLTGLGVEITKVLSEWEDHDTDIVVCFDSLTPLLQYVDVDRAVRFLQELSNRFDAVDARGHVHVDPDAHDRQTVGSLVAVVDDVVELDGVHPGPEAD